MHLFPDEPDCDACGAAATIHLRDEQSGNEYLYCKGHAPNLRPGENPHLKIQRYRSPPGSPCSRMLAADENSSEHQFFKVDMCDLHMLGNEGACRYYLSKLTEIDHFALWSDEFLDNMREYIIEATNGAAACFPFDGNTITFMTSLLKQTYFSARSDDKHKLTRREHAVVLLLHHPSWSDEQIAGQVPTTVKQLLRNPDYSVLKTAMKRSQAI